MFEILLNKQEKVIYEVLQQAQSQASISLKTLAEILAISPRMLHRQLNFWCAQPRNLPFDPFISLIDQQFWLPTTLAPQLELYASLLQKNPYLKLCWYLMEHPYTRLCDLEEVFYFSPSTIQRQALTLKKFLATYQIQLSFNHDPILKGCEFQIRWLAWILSLIFDPPFDWFSKEALFHRFEEVQHMRIAAGQSLNQRPTEKLIFSPDFSYLISEKGWQYLGKQFVGLEPARTSLESSPIFLLFQSNGDFFESYQKQVHKSPLAKEASFLVAEKNTNKYHAMAIVPDHQKSSK